MGKLISNHIPNVHNPSGLDLRNEVRVRVFKNIDIEVEFE